MILSAGLGGALFGLGLVMIWHGRRPYAEPLGAVLGRLGQPLPAEASAADSPFDRVAERLERANSVQRYLALVEGEMRVLGRRPVDEVRAMIKTLAVGLAVLPVLAVVGALVGVRVDPGLVMTLLPLVAVGLVFGRVARLRRRTRVRRDEMRAALAAYCNLVGSNLAAGRAVGQSLETAAQYGSGWAFAELRAALAASYARGVPAADTLEELGADLGVDELLEIAGSMRQAGTHGAAVRTTLGFKAKAIRERLARQAEGRAAKVTEHMVGPTLVIVMVLCAFYVYPLLTVLGG